MGAGCEDSEDPESFDVRWAGLGEQDGAVVEELSMVRTESCFSSECESKTDGPSLRWRGISGFHRAYLISPNPLYLGGYQETQVESS